MAKLSFVGDDVSSLASAAGKTYTFCMPQLVYLPNRHPNSFLVFSKSGDGYRLRDFSPKKGPPTEVETQSGSRKSSDVEAEAQEGGFFIHVPERPLSDYDYWREQTLRENHRIQKKVNSPAEPKSHFREIVIGVIVVVVSALILSWFGIKN